jgi:hypothetical protein
MSAHRLSPLVVAFGLAACAHAPSPGSAAAPGSTQETSTMTPTASASQAFSPRIDAEQSLLRLLALIRSSKTIQDITTERLQQTFEVTFTVDSGRSGFGERLTREWWSSIELDPKHPYGARVEFSFRPDQPGSYPPFSEICKIDFDRFAAELQTMGFSRETYRAEHNRVIHDLFQREGLSVTVYTRGEADSPPEKITHACVQMVLIN